MARAEGDNRPARYVEQLDDGREQVVYRASALNLCPSAFTALALGHTPSAPPPKMQAAYERGHDAEPLILASIEDTPKLDGKENSYTVVSTESKPVVELVIMDTNKKRVIVRGALDDVAYVSAQTRAGKELFVEKKAVVDAKNFGMAYWSLWLRNGIKAFPHYEWQFSVYQHGMARKGKEDFIPALMACRSSDTGKILVQWLETPPKSLNQIKSHVIDIEAECEEAIETGDVLACAKPSYPCPMWHLHDVVIEMPEKQIDLTIDAEDAEYAEYAEAVADWLEAKKDETKLAKRVKVAEDWRKKCAEVIRTMLDDRNVDASGENGVRIKVGDSVVFWKEETVPARQSAAYTKTVFNIGGK